MDGIPPVLATDTEDVVWALQTAEALWKRGERVDAIVWLRRAAQAAGESEDDTRAVMLARKAAELTERVAVHSASQAPEPVVESEPNQAAVDDLLSEPPRLGAESEVFTLSGGDIELLGGHEDEEPDPFRESYREPVISEGVIRVASNSPDVMLIEGEEDESTIEVVSGREPSEEPPPVEGAPDSTVESDALDARHLGSRGHDLPDLDDASLDESNDEGRRSVLTAAELHAGILDPWAEAERRSQLPVVTRAPSPAPPPSKPDAAPAAPAARGAGSPLPATAPTHAAPPARPAQPSPRTPPALRPSPPPAMTTASRSFEDDEVVTSAKPRAPNVAPPRAEQRVAPLPLPAPPPRAKPPLPRRLPPPRPALRDEPVTASFAQVADAPPTAPMMTTEMSSSDLMHDLESVPPSGGGAPFPPIASDRPTPVPVASAAPAERALLATPIPLSMPTPVPRSGPDGASFPTPPPMSIGSRATRAAPALSDAAAEPEMDLTVVEALADLPDDARDAFAAAATRHTIQRDEEVSHFALALVLDGEVDVAATITDSPALRLQKNAILRSRGTMRDGVALRLIGATDHATVATWDDAAVADAFRTCPWVEDDLRAVADRVQTKVGVTMGPLGERFDMALREHMTDKLTVRHLAPGEVVVERGKPVPLVIVGVGEIELLPLSGKPTVLRSGDFLLPEEIMSGGAASATARAGKSGALVLYGNRAVAQDLLMSFPPLLEIFSGM